MRGFGHSFVADPNRALFESVVRLLASVLDELVFVGGCTTGLFITDPAAGGIRPTKDVDAIVDVTSYAKYAALSERLRALGLAEDTTPGAPLCRWRRDELIVDVMPVGGQVLGFSNLWYPVAFETAQTLQIAGHEVRVVTPALLSPRRRPACAATLRSAASSFQMRRVRDDARFSRRGFERSTRQGPDGHVDQPGRRPAAGTCRSTARRPPRHR